jgi:hypothetical protein
MIVASPTPGTRPPRRILLSNRAGFTLSTLLILLLVLAVIGCIVGLFFWLRCKGCGSACASANPSLVELVPSEVHVHRAGSFQLAIRLRDADGWILGNSCEFWPEWEVIGADWLKPQPAGTNPFTRRFVANADPGAAQTGEVRVRVGEQEAATTVRMLETPATQDRVLADHDPLSPAEVALVTGAWGATCRSDSAIAFSGAALLGDVTDPGTCSKQGQVALFSTQRRFAHSAVAWQPASGGPDIVDFTSATALTMSMVQVSLRPTTIDLHVWIAADVGGSFDSARVAAEDEVGLAAAIFRRNRTGLHPRRAGGPTLTGVIAPDFGTCDQYLETLFTAETSGSIPNLRNTSVVNIIYCRNCATGSQAYVCPLNAGWSGQIVLNMNGLQPTDLAHELGHVLGLVAPYQGHVAVAGQDPLPGFTSKNLMWEWHDGHSRQNPDHFSLGQVFRMNVDSRSWVCRVGTSCPQWAGLPTNGQCQDDLGVPSYPSTPCPCLPADLSPPLNDEVPGVCDP